MGKIATKEAMRFMVDCLKAAGAGEKPAHQQAELLITADRMGHLSHGMNRLERYVNDIFSGACTPNETCKIVKESPATALVDAMNVLGATSGHFCMDLAMKKAKEVGVGWVTVKGANHFGLGGYWGKKAADLGFIGMAYTNSSPLMAPTRSKKPALGTNPLVVVAPASGGELFYLDMATTAVAVGKIEIQLRKGEPLPLGWAQGPDGKETTDAKLALKTKCLMPLGGSEKNSGYKGFGLAAMVDLFCGISSGSNYGLKVRAWSDDGSGGPPNLGQCFVAVDPSCFAPGFGDRLLDCIQTWRNLTPTDPKRPVMAPGDIEKKTIAETDKRGTISYVKQQIQSSDALAKKLKVKPMKVKLDLSLNTW